MLRLGPFWMAAFVLLLAVGGAPGALATPAGPGRLGHDGRWITDGQGRVVILHGINMVAKRPPYAPDAVGFGDDDAAFLAAEGFNTVRVGVIYKAVEPQPGIYDDAYLARIEQTVRVLAGHGIVSLVDFHQDLFNERFQGEGWPDWAIQDDGLPSQPQLGFPGNYLGMPALQRAFDHFWANDPGPSGIGLQDRYAAAWRHVAQRFAGVPGVLGYDLLNEPWPGTAWQPCALPALGCADFDAKLTAFSRRTIAAIREADPRTLVFYEPNVLFDFGAPTALRAIGDPRAVISFHDYCLAAPSPACDALYDLPFTNAAGHVAATHDASLLTEFGATDDADTLRSVLDASDRFMVGWQEWHYCGCDDPTTSGPGSTQALVLDPAKPPAGANVKSAKAALLARPYPQAVAGTPRTWGLDDARHGFTLRYATDRAEGALTEVAVPARAYPHGYAATAEGAAIVSAPAAATLLLAACPGAGEVRLTVRPGVGETSACARRLQARVTPRRLRSGRRTRLTVTVTAEGHPVSGATVSSGSAATTGADGVAVIPVRFRTPGLRTIRVRAPGSEPISTRVRVQRRRGRA